MNILGHATLENVNYRFRIQFYFPCLFRSGTLYSEDFNGYIYKIPAWEAAGSDNEIGKFGSKNAYIGKTCFSRKIVRAYMVATPCKFQLFTQLLVKASCIRELLTSSLSPTETPLLWRAQRRYTSGHEIYNDAKAARVTSPTVCYIVFIAESGTARLKCLFLNLRNLYGGVVVHFWLSA